ERDEAALAQSHAEIGCNLFCVAVAAIIEILTVAGVDLDAFFLPERVVDDTGDGIRTVLRGRSFAQDLQAVEGDGGQDSEVRTLRQRVGRVTGRNLYQRSPVETLPVDHDQRHVAREAAQR